MGEREKGEKRKENPNFLLTIQGVSSVGIRRAKSQSSSTRRGPCVHTKKEGFHRKSKGGDLEKSRISGLGGFLPVLLRFKW